MQIEANNFVNKNMRKIKSLKEEIQSERRKKLEKKFMEFAKGEIKVKIYK